MIKHYFTVAIRLIKRGFLFSSINILGFVFGITAAFLIYLWVVDELTFEDFQKDKNSIYRIIEMSKDESGEIKESAYSYASLADAFRKEFPQVKNATFIKYESKIPLEYNGNVFDVKYDYVDTTFFDVFSFPVVEGNPNLIKTDPEQLILSEKTARKIFGKESAVGKQVKHEQFSNVHYYTIAAVVKVPRKSHIQFEALHNMTQYHRRLASDWRFKESTYIYIQLNNDRVFTETDRKAMSRLLADKTGNNTVLAFQPITDIHLHTRFDDPSVSNHGSMAQIYLFIALSILVVFMGAFNFTTLTTARASLRYKEIGVRKVTGAKRKKLITQFLAESMIQAFLSLILALALTELLLPLFNRMVDKDISLSISWQVLLFVVVGIFVVGCLAGSYPAFYLSSLNPLMAFRGGKKTGRKGGFIRGLVCVQFIIAIALILCTSIVFKQLNYMQNKDLGLEKDNIICVHTNLWYSVGDFKQEVLKNPNVKSVAMGAEISNYRKGVSLEGTTIQWYNDAGQVDSVRMVQMWGDGDFAKTYGLELIKGEYLESDANAYWDGTYDYPAIINETAWKMMKVENPIGTQLKNARGNKVGKVVGVVKDFNFQPLRESIKPVFILFNPEALSWLHIKIAPENKQETLKFLKEKYEKISPYFSREFTYQFFTDALNKNYAHEQQQGRVFLIFTILAIVIAMMGVFGLVALSTRQRTKEIGIRKVNGAHSKRIVKMFCYEYMKWVGIAFVIACPLGYLFMSNWLNDFAYRTAISWWLFPLAGLIILAITMLTVIIQTYKTASQNPVNSLRYE